MSDEHDRPAGEPREAAHDRQIVGIHAVAVQLVKLLEDRRRVVERVGPLRVTRELRHLPRCQARENTRRERTTPGAQPRDLLPDVHLGVGGHEPELVDLRLELGDGLLEFQEAEGHGAEDASEGGAKQRGGSEAGGRGPKAGERLAS